ncbi:MAG: HEAT repeat domain-containing protein, partial [Acidimicrobiia bacterium]
MHRGRHPDIARSTAKRDVKGLVKALGCPGDGKVRAAAADALASLGDPRAVEPLVATLGDDHANVRTAAIAALGELADPRAVDALAAVLSRDHVLTGDAALSALVMIGAPSVDALVTTLENDNGFVREDAATALGQIGDMRAVEPLVATLHDNKESVRAAAAAALDRLGWSPDPGAAGAAYWVAKRQWGKCVKAAAIEPLVAVLHDEDEAVRKSASRVLVRIGARAVESLIDSLGWADWTTEAVLVDIGAPAVEPLVAHLHDERSGRREAIARVLGTIGDARAVEPLIPRLDDQADTVRSAAATALGRIGDTRAVEPLIPVLDDRANAVRAAAATALGRIGDTRAVEPLVGVVQGQTGFVRRDAADALDALGWSPDAGPAAVAYWIAKQHWDACVQVAAVEPLIAALGDAIGSVRTGAATALGQIADPRAVDALITVLNDNGEEVEV